MKIVIGSLFGAIVGLFIFFVMNFQHLLLVGQGKAGILIAMQLNNDVDMFMWGGAIIGAMVMLAQKVQVK
jgi:hypothetical protein